MKPYDGEERLMTTRKRSGIRLPLLAIPNLLGLTRGWQSRVNVGGSSPDQVAQHQAIQCGRVSPLLL